MFFMDKKKMLKKLLPMMAMFIAAVAIGVTGATVLHSLTLENTIKTPTVEGDVIEKDLDAKKVQFVNNGEADVFVRASFSEWWEQTNDAADSEKVILPNDAQLARPVIGGDWQKGDDGWYYYKKVLKGKNAAANEEDRYTALFIESVQFNNGSPITNLKEPYKNADYQLHVTMEIVQASDEAAVSKDATRELFGMVPNIGSSDETWKAQKYTTVLNWTK